MPWEFLNYLSMSGVDEIDEWEDTIPAKAVARLDWVLTFLRTAPQLKRPYVGTRANYSTHYEIVVTSFGREFRPLGCYGPGKQQFTLLVGAEEKGGALVPKNADSTADDHRKIIMKVPGRTKSRDE
jgi:hypothetical protein